MYYDEGWPPYVSVAERRAKAKKEMEKLRKKGQDVKPVELSGRKIAASFWGKGWCDHLESFSDFENRLPRGRTYVRNGSVCHLDVVAGRIEAMVSGSKLYKVTIEIKPLVHTAWDAIKRKCQGQIGSMLELLQGKMSDHVMQVVSDRAVGLFPQPGEIKLKCSCPDWATMCKHVAAVLYGVGSRLDHRPELLFLLRGVDAGELISVDMKLPPGALAPTDALAEGGLADIFGIDLDTGATPPAEEPTKTRKAGAAAKGKGKVAAPAKAPAIKAKKAAAPKKPKPAFNPKKPTGEGIARLRAQTGLSKRDFARALGVSVPAVKRWEDTAGPVGLQSNSLSALTRMQDEQTQK